MTSFEQPVVVFLATGTLLTEIGLLAYLILSVVKHFTDYRETEIESLNNILDRNYREIGLSFAAIATLGSLYLSNIMGWSPCRLCWFQRILMYPLVLLFLISIVLNRKKVSDYTLPLSIIGFATAVYHYLVQFLAQVQASGCSITQVSCEAKYTIYYGHISVPLMAAAAFAAIAILSYRDFRKR